MIYSISSHEGIDEPPFCISEVCQDSEIGPDLCSDGIDNDGDGLVDCADDECQLSQTAFTIGITVNNTSTCEQDEGSVIISVPADFSYDDYTICIDDNCADPATGIISNIPVGTYDIIMRDLNGCEVPFQVTPENTDVLCSDGVDNDGDGIADCDDLDCILNKGVVKNVDVCFDIGEELRNEILDIRANSKISTTCSLGEITDELMIETLTSCGSGCTVESFYEILNEDDIIIVDNSLSDCPNVYCVYENLFSNETKLFCETIGSLDDDAIITEIKIAETSGSGGTSFDPIKGKITIKLSPTLNCNDDNTGDVQNDLDIAGTILHEAYHAEMFRVLINAGYDPVSIDSYQSLWESTYVNHYANNGGTYTDAQHAIMVYTDNFIERLAKALYELNGDQSLSWRNFQRLAWEGLDYVHPIYDQNRDYQEGGDIWQLHTALLNSNPNLSIGCNN